MEDPIFIVGLPRSGSTLWLNILAQAHNICRINEIHYLTPLKKDFRYFLKKYIGNLSDEENIRKMVEFMLSRERIPGIHESFWHHDIGKIQDTNIKKVLKNKILESNKSLGSIFKIIIEEISAINGYTRCCVKFPVYVNYVNKLLQWYPKSKIVHITRDPRAIAISRANDPGGTARRIREHPHASYIIKKTMIYFVVAQYIWTSKLHCKFNGISNYALFRYEDLLKDPERVVKKLCRFTEIDFVPEMLEPEKGQPSSVTGKRHKGFNKKSATHWRKIISSFDEKIITGITKGSMRRFGYDNYKN